MKENETTWKKDSQGEKVKASQSKERVSESEDQGEDKRLAKKCNKPPQRVTVDVAMATTHSLTAIIAAADTMTTTSLVNNLYRCYHHGNTFKTSPCNALQRPRYTCSSKILTTFLRINQP
ncbi:hypothetical protein Pcinc_040672 [Petrolisthes cinctipes]|uniref:Uncharacterized protein n=1 Tax=Petrolisthes cinctipes TaxID=88211 RepID=A0AAE1BLS3_PETCI|nr:hypothetical protein Pcinc_040672 [Petrolisthes cinctipes]